MPRINGSEVSGLQPSGAPRSGASRSGARAYRAARFALVLAPVLALGACDQITALLKQFEPAVEQVGTPKIEDVAAEFRAVAGAVQPESAMPELTLAPAEFVPGEILVGAKVRDEVAGVASAMGLALPKALLSGGVSLQELLTLDPQVQIKAVEEAVEEAKADARTVLQRLRVEGAEIVPDASGLLKIDLRGPSPTRYQEKAAAEPAAAQPDAPAQPEAVADTGQRCPRGVTPAQLDADLVLKTICTQERLKASGQFEFVEKNYVITVDRMEWLNPPKSPPAQPAPTPGQTTPGQPAPGKTAPLPGGEQTATGALPNDPLLGLQWHYRANGAGQGQSAGGAGFEPYWINARNVGSRAVRVAVIDTGIESNHPDVKGNPNILQGIDLVTDFSRSNDADGVDRDANDPGDACRPGSENSFHGTHVAGTIGAAMTNDRKGVASGAWNVSVLPVRAIGKCGGELEDIINAVRWSAGLAPAVTETGDQILNPTPADIINMSLSVPIPCPSSMQAAIDAAVARGSVVVVAAGNKGNPVRHFAPANCQNVIVVGAGDAKGGLAFYSNFGPEVDIIAPGGDVFADSDSDGRPDGVLSIRSTRNDCFDPATKQAAPVCNYGYLQGTSMAAPHVAAALALLQSQLNVRGRALEEALFTRAVGPVDAVASCAIRCDRNPNATTRVPGAQDLCMRECGRGRLDLGRAAAAPATPAATPAGGG
jgi:serine protease